MSSASRQRLRRSRSSSPSGSTKAITNLVAGALADRFGRKPVLVAGWLVGLPVPFMIILAPDWGWVVAANVLLGINQGLTWSTTVS